jgi:hypothetical protein
VTHPYTAQAQPDSPSVINLYTAAAQHNTLHMLQMHVLEAFSVVPTPQAITALQVPEHWCYTRSCMRVLAPLSLRHTRRGAFLAVALASRGLNAAHTLLTAPHRAILPCCCPVCSKPMQQVGYPTPQGPASYRCLPEHGCTLLIAAQTLLTLLSCCSTAIEDGWRCAATNTSLHILRGGGFYKLIVSPLGGTLQVSRIGAMVLPASHHAMLSCCCAFCPQPLRMVAAGCVPM